MTEKKTKPYYRTMQYVVRLYHYVLDLVQILRLSFGISTSTTSEKNENTNDKRQKQWAKKV
jgi:hypothetical protein